jgi:hypothetical protein
MGIQQLSVAWLQRNVNALSTEYMKAKTHVNLNFGLILEWLDLIFCMNLSDMLKVCSIIFGNRDLRSVLRSLTDVNSSC